MNFDITDSFIDRHIGPNSKEISEMVKETGFKSIDELLEKIIHKSIRVENDLDIGVGLSEYELLNELNIIASKNKVFKNYIGMGYNPTITPSVIRRNIFENPGWYTQYTPYQAEISQGRLEALINFQTMVSDLTALPLANASLLDEATAAAEAMLMFYNSRKGSKKQSNVFLVADDVFPQTIDVLKTRSAPLGIDLKILPVNDFYLNDEVFGLLVQYPNSFGEIFNFKSLFHNAKEESIYTVVAADLLSLTMIIPPGEFGADCAVGSTQRFGVPIGFGGPHAAYFTTKEEFKRQIPGRIIGVSQDQHGNLAYRMALQTREQHIKREKATSNICTAQVLLAIMAATYSVYHGPNGLKKIAHRINELTKLLVNLLSDLELEHENNSFFDTVLLNVRAPEKLLQIKEMAINSEINLRYIDDIHIGISLNETTQLRDILVISNIFREVFGKEKYDENSIKIIKNKNINHSYQSELIRKSDFLTHPTFNIYHSETELMRYLKRLENKDLSLTSSMIPLGSCTMKLNSVTEMLPVSWPQFSQIHPYAPNEQTTGYYELFDALEKQLCEITGFAGVSLQPNSGAQGEYAGLLVIREYHRSRDEGHRNIVLIPSSAHGTNPASSIMAGNKVVIVGCDKYGNVNFDELQEKAKLHKENLSAMMLTYPSTHGVFEDKVVEMCKVIHDNGGLVYLDGANMNAQVGYTNPAIIGADICHLNLHKTFAIPHGGGGPGVGPIAVAEHLVEFLPGHVVKNINKTNSINAVSAAPWGSASILPISYAYIRMMGGRGLKMATEVAILNANYIKSKLSPFYKVLYTGINGNVGHELIFDMREFKLSVSITEIDIAKRLMDYGFHAPTVSFPVAGTLMVEPTESESKTELDRFCNAMTAIRDEISKIENGEFDKLDNPLKNAPHTVAECTSDKWNHLYSRETASFPITYLRDNKYWPPVGRIDDAFGDRNLFCSCIPVNQFMEEE